MHTFDPRGRMTAKLVDALYVEAMVLADEARSYFDQNGKPDRDSLTPMARVGFSCEALKVTTRLMHVIAWLLTRRAVEAGEISSDQARQPARRLGDAAPSDAEIVVGLPAAAREIISASADLYARVARFDEDIDRPMSSASPARGLISRLERAF